MDADPLRVKRLPWVLGGMAFVLYLMTGARTIQWQDSAQFTYRIATGEIQNMYGLAMVHPLHFMLGRLAATLFPHHLPWALSGVSALGGALAVGLTSACMRELTRKAGAVIYTGLTLMLAHTFWRFSCLPEVYTWSAALMMAQVWLVLRATRRRRRLPWPLLFGINGAAWSNHNLALLTLSVWGIWFLLHLRKNSTLWKTIPRILFCWILGSLPYLLLILQEGFLTGDWPATVHSALFGHGFREEVSGLFPRPAFTAISLAFLALSFPGLALPLALRSRKTREQGTPLLPGVLYALCAVHLIFFLRYNVIDQYTFLIPVFPLLSLMAGVGREGVRSPKWRKAAWIMLALQIPLYALAPSIVRATGVLEPFARNKPFRDDAEYLMWPWRVQDRSAHRLAENALEAARPDGTVVIADPMAVHTLHWMRREKGLEDHILLLKAEDHEEMLYFLQRQKRLVWAPLRSTDPVPPGWREENGVWVAETAANPPSTSAPESDTLNP